MPGYIHHVEWCVKDAISTYKKLVHHFDFVLIAHRETSNAKQFMIQSNQTLFIITQKLQKTKKIESTTYPVLFCCLDDETHQKDSVFNIALVVHDVNALTDNIKNTSVSSVILPATTIYDDGVSIRLAVVKSCCGNIIHTLMTGDHISKNGFILPGFEPILVLKTNAKHLTHFIDHVTYVCEEEESCAILDWYATFFGMERFKINANSNADGTFVIDSDDVGLKLSVGEWISSWLCSEIGTQSNPRRTSQFESTLYGHRHCSLSKSCSVSEEFNFKLVIAEPVKSCVKSHIRTFLKENGGPGIQHIGLTTFDILTCIKKMSIERGTSFRKPPPTYYCLENKRNEIMQAMNGDDEAVDMFRKLGLLIDSEADTESDVRDKFLIQIFTRPIFAEETFFLEILERKGARGFGAGNITALAKSIALCRNLT